MEITQKNPNETILEMLERGGANPESHCRDGFCGMCRTKVNPEDLKNIVPVKDSIGYHDTTTEILACSSTLGTGKVDLLLGSTESPVRLLHYAQVTILDNIDVQSLTSNIDIQFSKQQTQSAVIT